MPTSGGGQRPRTDVGSRPSHPPPTWPPQARLCLVSTALRHVCPLVTGSTTSQNQPRGRSAPEEDRETARAGRPDSVSKTEAGRRRRREQVQSLPGPEHTAVPGPGAGSTSGGSSCLPHIKPRLGSASLRKMKTCEDFWEGAHLPWTAVQTRSQRGAKGLLRHEPRVTCGLTASRLLQDGRGLPGAPHGAWAHSLCHHTDAHAASPSPRAGSRAVPAANRTRTRTSAPLLQRGYTAGSRRPRRRHR